MKGTVDQILTGARDSIAAAELLLREGYPDFAGSRAYYAMFYAAAAALAADGDRYDKHSAVIAEFGRRYAATGRLPKELHGYLRVGFERRNRADYWHGERLSVAEATELIEHAREFVAAIEEHLREREA